MRPSIDKYVRYIPLVVICFAIVATTYSQSASSGGGSTQNTVGGGGSGGLFTNTVFPYAISGVTAIDLDSSHVGDLTFSWTNGNPAYSITMSTPTKLHQWYDSGGVLLAYLGGSGNGLTLAAGVPLNDIYPDNFLTNVTLTGATYGPRGGHSLVITNSGASLSTFNRFATSNLFMDRVAINTNFFDNDTTQVLVVAPKPGQTSSNVKIIYAGLGSSCILRLSDPDISGPFANFTINSSGQMRLTTGGSGATGGNIGSASFDHMVWDQTGHVTFGDGSAQTFNFISGSVIKVGSQFTGNRNTTNMLGTGISNVTVFSQGLFVTNFTIP